MFNGLNPIPARVDRLVGLQELGELHGGFAEEFNLMEHQTKKNN
jgi:hypothetical protein